jgi:hypothetical protein
MELMVFTGALLALATASLLWGVDSRRLDPRKKRREGLF